MYEREIPTKNFSASEAFDGTFPTNVVVTSDGTCTYIPPGIFKVVFCNRKSPIFLVLMILIFIVFAVFVSN